MGTGQRRGFRQDALGTYRSVDGGKYGAHGFYYKTFRAKGSRTASAAAATTRNIAALERTAWGSALCPARSLGDTAQRDSLAELVPTGDGTGDGHGIRYCQLRRHGKSEHEEHT